MHRLATIALTASIAMAACGGGDAASPSTPSSTSVSADPPSGAVDVGGYELNYECKGEGEPTVILEAGLGAAGTEEFFGFINQVARISRVCTYDRAGTGVSDERP